MQMTRPRLSDDSGEGGICKEEGGPTEPVALPTEGEGPALPGGRGERAARVSAHVPELAAS
jgi:hypothetical protein